MKFKVGDWLKRTDPKFQYMTYEVIYVDPDNKKYAYKSYTSGTYTTTVKEWDSELVERYCYKISKLDKVLE